MHLKENGGLDIVRVGNTQSLDVITYSLGMQTDSHPNKTVFAIFLE